MASCPAAFSAVLHWHFTQGLLGVQQGSRSVESTVCVAGDDTWVIVASDGLFENEVRGGGGGLENQQVVDICLKAKDGISAKQLARELIDAAQSEGTTDDVTVALLKLSV